MIAFRVLQGFTGGAMVPSVFVVGMTIFSGKQRALIPAILGMVSVLAPTLGPTVGGLITESIDWRWIFFINVVPGIVVTTLAIMVIRVDRPNLAMFRRIDWLQLAAMAIFLTGLEYVLEEGPRHDWFDDARIQTGAWLSCVGFALFLERSFFSASPIVKLSPFRKPTFAFACVFNLVIGFGIYASTYLIPVFLGRVRGYSSLDIGLTVWVVGIAQIASTLIAARLSEAVDRRVVIPVGLALFATSLWLSSHMTSQWGFAELLCAAGGARICGDAVHRAERRHGAVGVSGTGAAAGVGTVQSDAESRRRGRHRGGEHLVAGQRPHSSATVQRNAGAGRRHCP